jgi:transposase
MERVRSKKLLDSDTQLIQSLIETLTCINDSMDENARTIKKLLEMIFGHKTEKKENLFPEIPNEENDDSEDSTENLSPKGTDPKKKPSGSGRLGAADYKGAKRVCVNHESLKAGDICPDCLKGKVYPKKEFGTLVRFTGNAPLEATVYELEKMRCNLCGVIFTAKTPDGVGEDKYDAKAIAMVALLKYGSGMPFYRLESLQKALDIPLPDATQWEMVCSGLKPLTPVADKLFDTAANGQLFHNDDTSARILEYMGKRGKKAPPDKSLDPKRKGLFTTGIIAQSGDNRISIFSSGRHHAGENLRKLLQKRKLGLEAPIHMCDALPANIPKEFKTVLAHCLAHSRRKFVEVIASFPEDCRYVIETLATVYHNDDITKEQLMNSDERLLYHQKNSKNLMTELKTWMKERVDQKLVEPGSGLGAAITYTLKHWKPLTCFLNQAGAPLDNNICYAVNGITNIMPYP